MNPNLKELKELLVFAFALQNAIKEVLEDKKVNFLDAFKFMPVLPTVKPAFEGLGNPIDRLRSLTPDELEELHEYFVREFDIPNDEIEALVERTIVNIAETIHLSTLWIALAKK